MKISLNWLRRYVDVDWDADTIAERLTLVGLEVDGVHRIEADFTGVRVGKVQAVRPHPGADRLQIAQVDTGDDVLDVVCGAPNCRAGLTVAYAGLGARLPGGFKIKKAKIRGEISLGMLCSEDELGLSEASEGILELPGDLPAGQPLEQALPIEDVVFDLGITANRGDCLSHLGVARELAALAGVPLKWPEASFPVTTEGEPVPVTVADPTRCARYVGRVVRGLGVAPSPLWMQRLLSAVGVRPINNLVDVTNFVLFEYGQPLHAFDLRDLEGPAIVVRTAEAGERMTTLDDVERTLTADDLVICDAARPVALAGVMGGQNSEVKDDTTDVLLESAWFEPTTVRLTSRRLGLRSESSHRFERSVDPERTVEAANRALHLLCALSAPGTSPQVVEAFTDARPRVVARPTVEYDPAHCTRLLGVELPAARQREALERLGFAVQGAEAGPWSVQTPSWRNDVDEAADLVEEVARYVGYAIIPTPPPRVTARTGTDAGYARSRRVRRARELLNGRGFHQALNYSFLGKALQAHFAAEAPLELLNPLSEDQRALRMLLAPRLVENAAHNLRHGAEGVRLFEVGRVFLPRGAGVQPAEVERLGLVWAGPAADHWQGGPREVDFFDLKGLLVDLCAMLGRPAPTLTPAERPWLHPGATATVRLEGADLGVIGELHPGLARTLDLGARLFVAELDLEPLVGAAAPAPRFVDFGRFPAVTRDLALRLPRTVLAAQVLSSIEELALGYVDSVRVFDVYEGGSLGADERSLGLRVTYRAPDRTLTDEDVSAAHGRLVDHLRDAFSAQLR
ncbi:MAG: phenylalanine--tRNA ligase subunit beta [Myxococcales bacterium]|nr:phenylalanine--tRNA ligase subunit beta [Myxococcales bacterium]